MKNPREVAIKILENAKKALKEKMESLEKAEGKNTAQLNEFKGIPQPPAPKAPEKAIAPTPKIPQPKMPSLGKPSRPLSSFMKSRMEKANLNKARVDEGMNIQQKQLNRKKRNLRVSGPTEEGEMPKTKGVPYPVHRPINTGEQRKIINRVQGLKQDLKNARQNNDFNRVWGFSEAIDKQNKEAKQAAVQRRIDNINSKKPTLPKSEEMNKAKIYDIKSKKMIADHGEPEKTTPPKGDLKLVGSASAKPQSKTPIKKQPKSAK